MANIDKHTSKLVYLLCILCIDYAGKTPQSLAMCIYKCVCVCVCIYILFFTKEKVKSVYSFHSSLFNPFCDKQRRRNLRKVLRKEKNKKEKKNVDKSYKFHDIQA
jgi:hypothetical protein